MSKQELWYLRTESGEVIGPFPAPMLIRHQLLGRVKPADEVSLDKVSWECVSDIAELRPTAMPVASEPVIDDPFWNAERSKAKLRWAEERQFADRRGESTPTSIQSNARSGKERRASPLTSITQRDRSKLHGDGHNWIAIALVLIGCAALVGGLIWLGTVTEPVNPLNVKITR